jgi:hypothetical protein
MFHRIFLMQTSSIMTEAIPGIVDWTIISRSRVRKTKTIQVWVYAQFIFSPLCLCTDAAHVPCDVEIERESRDEPGFDETEASLQVMSRHGSTNSATNELQILDKMTNSYLTKNTVPPVDNESSLRILTKLSTVASKEELESPMAASPRYTPAMLPGNRGVLISGRVSAVENIAERSAKDSSDIFYRVYYQEGAAAAKSNIFNSDVVKTFRFDGAEASSAAWNKHNNSFPFEMVLPRNVSNICQIDGELLFSFFRMRAQGGNDIIGHLQFRLKDLANRAPSASRQQPEQRKRRTSKYREVEEQLDESLEIRTIDGTFVVCSKTGSQYKPVPDGAEVKLRLDLVWRQADYSVEAAADTDARRPGTASSAQSRDRSRSPSASQASSQRSLLSRPASAGSTRTGASAAASLKQVAANAARAVSREKTRGTKKPAAPVSLHAKVNRERQLKIDRENKLMASKLGKMSAKPKGGAYTGEVVIPKAQPLNAPAEAREPLKTRYADTAEKDAAKRELAALTAQWTAVKGDVSALEASNKEATAQIQKYQLLIKQCSMTSSRIKKQTNTSSGASVAQSEAGGKQSADVGRIMNKYVPRDEPEPGPGAKSGECTMETIAARRESELKELEAAGDAELQDNLAELIALQESRRVLVRRIAHARSFCAAHAKDFASMEATAALVQSRLLGAPAAPKSDDAASVSSRMSSASCNRTSSSATRSRPAPKKSAGLYEEDEPPAPAPLDHDGQLRLRIKNITREIRCLEESLSEETYNLKLDADLDEASTIRSHLQDKMKQLTEQLEALTYTRDQYHASLSLYSGEESSDEQGSEIIRLKHGINQLRMKLLRGKNSRQDQEMYAKMSDFEVELTRQNRG